MERYYSLKAEVFAAYSGPDGPQCTCCGESTFEFLQVDHVNNDGAEHRRQLGGQCIYSWLKQHDFPKGFQLLCCNCNSAKRLTGVCPHQQRSVTKSGCAAAVVH